MRNALGEIAATQFFFSARIWRCPLLAQSGHPELHRTCPLLGVKRTWRFALQMSAFDPKRTSRPVSVSGQLCRFSLAPGSKVLGFMRSGKRGLRGHMRRREFIMLLCSAAALRPLAASAQQPAMPVIGFLHLASAKPFEGFCGSLSPGFERSRFHRGPERCDRVPLGRWRATAVFRPLAIELVRLQVTVIVAGGSEATALAVKAATSTIPVVCNVGSDPVRLGLVARSSRPGGNMTGVNILTSELGAKRVGLLHDLAPPPRQSSLTSSIRTFRQLRST